MNHYALHQMYPKWREILQPYHVPLEPSVVIFQSKSCNLFSWVSLLSPLGANTRFCRSVLLPVTGGCIWSSLHSHTRVTASFISHCSVVAPSSSVYLTSVAGQPVPLRWDIELLSPLLAVTNKALPVFIICTVSV